MSVGMIGLVGILALWQPGETSAPAGPFISDLWHTSVQALKQNRNVEVAE